MRMGTVTRLAEVWMISGMNAETCYPDYATMLYRLN
jgi:hypothetical protein